MNENSHNVAVTGIIIKEGKYLITQRALTKRNFPGKWTVPGGNLEVRDYIDKPKDTSVHWYNVVEEVLKTRSQRRSWPGNKKYWLYYKHDFYSTR